jgi:spore coat protein JB
MDRIEQLRLLRQLQEIDFVLLELNLYLDTHHDDMNALEQYNWYAQQRAGLVSTYEQQYGPLTNFGHTLTRFPCGWDEGPWPWEM